MASFKDLPMYDDSVAESTRAKLDSADLQAQRALGQVPQHEWNKRTIQQGAGDLVRQRSEIQAEGFQQQLGSQTEQAELALTEKQLVSKQKIHDLRMKNEEMHQANNQRINLLSSSLSKIMLDNQLQFREDEIGRAIWTDQQLADWSFIQAKNAEELSN